MVSATTLRIGGHEKPSERPLRMIAHPQDRKHQHHGEDPALAPYASLLT